ncbi:MULTISPECIES: AbgT family transporter [Fictibacillus]|uniref:Transporter n=1 Tax=Fictibacillus enclensis TaxID=1017270 RepID=A0A0V8J253_9BACL|nr:MULTISPECIES: AbgT family transporter [Fictibacillus]KSU81101.1 transporter [Fictibacillus enclensis]RXZ02698.1 AbgT family transporter [Fictibacillus sp. S7]SCC35062.1 aminobenzoyl-glutamate transport protein [Fictibacillus enclensis]
MAELSASVQKRSARGISGFLNTIERLGNRLPHPFMLFVYLALFMIVLSAIVSLFDVSVVHPATKETLKVKSLISGEGLKFMLTSMLENFTGFKPLGLVLAMVLGIGLTQRVGLFESVITKTIIKAHKSVITYTVFFIGIMGNIASDAAFVIIPPLAAVVFYSIGRNPIAGLAAGFASSGIGFTANILIAGTDALLSGISTEVAQSIDANASVSPVDNWYFMSVSTVVLTIVGGLMTEKFIEPRLGAYDGETGKKELDFTSNALENKALRNAFFAAILYIGLVALVLFIPNSPLRGEGGTIIPSPFLDGIVPIILLFFITVGVTFGVTMKKIKKTGDVPALMTDSIRDMAGYIVLVFAIAQFIAYFNWSNLATWIAVNTADGLSSINLTGLPVVIGFVLVTAFLSLFIISGSALWALEAPVFMPMLMLLNYNPAFIQVAYRIGESSTNMVTPLNPYFAILLTFMNEYDKKAGIGTLMSLMIPYTIVFLVVWIILLLAFGLLGIPVGPGVGMYIN